MAGDADGPTTAGAEVGVMFEVETGGAGDVAGVIEERLEGDFIGGILRFVEGHRAHSEADDAAGAGVAGVMLGVGGGGAGENVLVGEVGLIDVIADGVPEEWGVLPFVDEARLFSLEEEAGFFLGKFKVIFDGFWILELEGAFGKLAGGGGFTTPFTALEEDGAVKIKLIFKSLIDEAGEVGWFHSIIITRIGGFGEDFLVNLGEKFWRIWGLWGWRVWGDALNCVKMR